MEIEATSIIDGKEIKKTSDDVMFTQYGLSGPAILNISREISIHLNRNKKNNAKVKLNFFPGMSYEEVKELLKHRWEKRPDQTIELSLNGIFPPKLPPVLLKLCKIHKDIKVKDLNQIKIDQLLKNLTGFEVNISDTRGWNEAEFTAGGIDTKQVKVGTLESQIHENLYFCGEILDVDGDVGGFNLSWAWSSGFVAGKLLKL
jgi:predicted Rossmann fold flavoprotein